MSKEKQPPTTVTESPATLAYIYAVDALADVTLSPELLEAAKAAYEDARDAWLASDEARGWQVGGESWGQSWGDVTLMTRPSEIEAELQDCCRNGSWETEKTMWVSDFACPIDPVTDSPLYGERVEVTTTIDPEEPDCTGEEHDWQSPHEVVGGCEENAGVHGHGGGVIITEVCSHCGKYKSTDTWAQNRSTGEQGLTSIEYAEADEKSEQWLATLRDIADAP